MKVIDLLNKIATGEMNEDTLIEFDNGYRDYCSVRIFFDRYIVDRENLNCEIEIIEDTPKEDKRIEKLESYISCGWNGTCKDLKRECLFKDLKKIGAKINEIIDYLESKGE